MGIGGWPGPYNDYRTTWAWFSVGTSNTALTEDEQYDYFFVPAVGYYENGTYYANRIAYQTSTWNYDMGSRYQLYEDFAGLAVYYSGAGDASPAVPFF